jgi:acyl carrier protein
VDDGAIDRCVEEIGSYLATTLGAGAGGIGPDEALLGDLLDSIALLTLATHLEETYGITVGAHEVEAENFGTLRALAGFVARKAARP